ncbi:MAG: hypothetical protein N2654_00930 [Deltaproteobacteria bacterium]|nr:hypothetical protein [Deltaproteobacteria bacterium]
MTKISFISTGLLILISVILRTFNLKNDIHVHPDERFIMMTVFDFQEKGLYPPNFNYGQFPFYLLYFFYKGLVFFNILWNDFDSVYIAGRLLVTIVFLVQLFFVNSIMKLVGASIVSRNFTLWLYSINPFSVQQCRFFTVDPFLSFFLVMMVYFVMKNKSIASGACLGLALASKITALVGIAFLLVYSFIQASADRNFLRWIKFYFWALIAAFIVFFISNPFFFVFFDRALSDTLAEIRLSRGLDTRPYTLQFVGTVSPFYQVEHLLKTARPEILFLGIVFLPLCIMRAPAFVILLAFLIFLVPALTSFTKFPRYFLPSFPFVFIFAGCALDLIRNLGLRSLIFSVLLFFQSLYCYTFLAIYFEKHPYWSASVFIKQNFPQLTVGNPSWDDVIPINGEEAGIKYVTLDYYGFENGDGQKKFFEELQKVDFLIFPTQRIPLSFARSNDKYPKTSKLINLIFENIENPEYFQLVYASNDPPNILGFQYLDYCFDESLTVYNYSRVIIFKVLKKLDHETFLERFNQTRIFDFSKFCSVYSKTKGMYLE